MTTVENTEALRSVLSLDYLENRKLPAFVCWSVLLLLNGEHTKQLLIITPSLQQE